MDKYQSFLNLWTNLSDSDLENELIKLMKIAENENHDYLVVLESILHIIDSQGICKRDTFSKKVINTVGTWIKNNWQHDCYEFVDISLTIIVNLGMYDFIEWLVLVKNECSDEDILFLLEEGISDIKESMDE